MINHPGSVTFFIRLEPDKNKSWRMGTERAYK
jgi:hypothetical protein